jgi:hypothetical protein
VKIRVIRGQKFIGQRAKNRYFCDVQQYPYPDNPDFILLSTLFQRKKLWQNSNTISVGAAVSVCPSE